MKKYLLLSLFPIAAVIAVIVSVSSCDCCEEPIELNTEYCQKVKEYNEYEYRNCKVFCKDTCGLVPEKFSEYERCVNFGYKLDCQQFIRCEAKSPCKDSMFCNFWNKLR